MERETYEETCKRAATNQGFDPIMETLAAAGVEYSLDQTGGFCMAVSVPVPGGAYVFGSDFTLEGQGHVDMGFFPGASWYDGENYPEDPDVWELTKDALKAFAHVAARAQLAVVRTETIPESNGLPLRLSFSPDAIREHFDDDPEGALVASLDDATLAAIGEAALSDDALYEAFHQSLTAALTEKIGAQA